MKLPSSDIHTETNLNTKEYQFKIDENDQGIIFEMLRSKIYKDPIGSICREIASNSRDSHRESKKPNLPIEITINSKSIMNNGSTTIEFKDFGTGISEDRMENIFCKYAASTKRDTNMMTGGFGLGAKTPFSYSDIFYIRTVFDKVLYTYTAYIDESKKGKITLHKKVKSEEGNFTSIIVPIKNENDRNRFEIECKTYTNYWPVKPVFKNFYLKDEYKDKVLYEKDNYKLVKKHNRHQGPIALIDGIPYTIDTNADTMFNKQFTYSSPVTVMIFKNGELDISINRENLQYTKRTTNALNKRFKIISKTFLKHFENYIKDSKNYLEACFKMYSVGRSNNDDENHTIYSWINFYKVSGALNISYKNKVITDRINIERLRFTKYILSGDKVHLERIYGSHLSELYHNDLYLLPEGKSTSTAVNLQILKDSKISKSFIILGLRKYPKRKPAEDASSYKKQQYDNDQKIFEQDIKKEYKIVTETLGKELIDYSTIKSNTGTNGERALPTSTHIRIFNKPRWNHSYNWNNLVLSKNQIIKHENKYAYVVVDKGGDHHTISNEDRINYFIAAVYNSKELICITKRQEKYFKNYKSAKELYKTIDKKFFNNYVDYMSLKNLISSFDDNYSKYKFNDTIKNKVDFASAAFNKFENDSKILKLHNNDDAIRHHIKTGISPYVVEFDKIISEIPKKYPLLKSISRWNIDKGTVDEVNFYIKCKEKELETN